MRTAPRVLLVAAAILLPLRLPAQEARLTLADCVALARERNHLLRAAGENVQASLARARQAWALPQPTLDIDSDLQPGLTDFDRHGERYLGISQTVPFPLRTWAEAGIARRESDGIVADRDVLALDLTFQVTEAFYLVLLAQEQEGYAQLNLELAQDFLAITETKVSAGDVPRVEQVRAGVEVARAVNEVRRAEASLRLAKARMNVILARDPSAPLQLQGDLRAPLLAFQLDSLRAAAVESRPELRKNALALERESLQKKAGYLSYLPDVDIGAARHTLRGEPTTWDVTLSVALPLYFWQPVIGEIAEASANQRALREERAQLLNAVRLEVEETYASLVAAGDQIRVFEKDILPQAEEAYGMYLFSYEQGEISALEMIEAWRTLNDVRTSYADALYGYGIATAGLERSVGRAIREIHHEVEPEEPGVAGARQHSSVGLRERYRLQRRFRGGRGDE
jgi:cobalt-zinc-cadmium efflux system outer membrane protein